MATPMKDITEVRMTLTDETSNEEKKPEALPKKGDQNPRGRRKKETREKPEKGIGPRCPTIYLLQEEKTYLDRLKAYITLSTGEKPYDHVLVMTALKEYVRKNYKEFSERY